MDILQSGCDHKEQLGDVFPNLEKPGYCDSPILTYVISLVSSNEDSLIIQIVWDIGREGKCWFGAANPRQVEILKCDCRL